MLLDGVSIRGSYHNINQDCYKTHAINNGFVVALSDGLGSKKYSQVGSKAICESIVEEAAELQERLYKINPPELISNIHKRWLERIKPYEVDECNATMLALIVYKGRCIVFRLGDGFIGICKDDETEVIFDKKEDYYANETDCLTEHLELDRVEIREFEISELYGGLICSDGIGIGTMQEEELKGFTKDFVDAYCGMKNDDILSDIKSWLSDWSGSDDKTLAYFVSEEK